MLQVLGALVVLVLSSSRTLSAPATATGPEIRVSGNRPVRQFEESPAVAADGAGNVVVVWEAGPLGFPTVGVRARRYDASGAPLGPDFQVNTSTLGYNSFPDVAADSAGNFVVVWNGYGPDGSADVLARRYDGGGTALSGEMQVNSYATGQQTIPRIARAPGGSFVVVWQDFFRGIFGQRFDAAGVPQGGEFQANTYTTDAQAFPEVGTDTAGNFVVVWSSLSQDGSGFGAFGQRYDASGATQGGKFQVNTYTSSNQYATSVAMLAGGGFVVGMFDYLQGPGEAAFARRYDAAGVPQGSEFLLTLGRTRPTVAADTSGGFVAAWHDGDVVARQYDAAAVPLGAEFTVNSFTTSYQDAPDVAALPAGGFVVAWQSFGQFASDPHGREAMAQRFTTTCGDGAVQPGESCDDGATVGGDGCSHACVTESCYACAGVPSTCTPIGACAHGDDCCPAGCEAATDDDCPTSIAGRRLAIRETLGFPGEYRRNLTFVTKDPAVDTSLATGVDPAADGASLHVYNPATGDSACFELEPVLSATWQSAGQDPAAPILRYKDRDAVNGACRMARIADGKLLKVTCRGSSDTVPILYSLDEPSQGSVAVRFRSDTTEYCTVFGGTVTFDQQFRLFNAKMAPPPATCPVPPVPCP